MKPEQYAESELILNPDGSVYHLHLLPEQLAEIVLLVGDPARVAQISRHFDRLEVQIQNREFVTHTGIYGGKRISVISTGIGTDNIDIVLNELDALVNFDLQRRLPQRERTSLNLIRLGTSGTLQRDIPVDSPVVSEYAIGFDGLLNWYAGRDSVSETEMERDLVNYLSWDARLGAPYIVKASSGLLLALGSDLRKGITITAPGFYGPQGRTLSLSPSHPSWNDKLEQFRMRGLTITNYEMECSALYGLAKLLGHKALTVCNIIAHRQRQEFSPDYHQSMDRLVTLILDRIGDLRG
jgi:uridine phosphorylase